MFAGLGRKTLSVLFICFASIGSFYAHANSQIRRIVFLGDSLTAGYQLPKNQAFPAKIQAKIEEEKLPWKAINAGVSGDTSAGALSRLNWVLKQNPDIIFLCIGANDGMRGIMPSQTEKNIESIILKAKPHVSEFVLAGIKLPTNFGIQHVKNFEQIYPKLAKKHKLVFLPFLLEGVALQTKYNLDDGIHPNSAGTTVIAELVWEVIKPLLTKDLRTP